MRSRVISLNFPTVSIRSEVSLSVSDTEVQEASRLINDTLISQGFIRDENPAMAGAQGFIASYSKFDNEGLRSLGDCPFVWLNGNRVEVLFAQGRAPDARFNADTKKTIDSLLAELKARYGTTRVNVERRSN